MYTVSTIAKLAGLSSDDALVRLWENGLFSLENEDSEIEFANEEKALLALGVVRTRPQPTKKISWWLAYLNLSGEEFYGVLSELNCSHPGNSKNLPKGAFKKLERKYRSVLADQFSQIISAAEIESDIQEIQMIEAPQRQIIGTITNIEYLETPDVEAIHQELERSFSSSEDPISPPGVKDFNLLDSAVQRPVLALEKYPTVEMATASMVHSLIKNHPFYNGNKRAGIVAMLVMLDKNGIKLVCNESDLFSFALKIADSKLMPEPRNLYKQFADHEVLEMAYWIAQHSHRIAPDSRVRSLKWAELKSILSDYNCNIEYQKKKIKISRPDHMSSSSLFRNPLNPLKVKIDQPYGEVDKGLIQEIRKSLKLDSRYISNGEFFSSKKVATAGFIFEYSRLLKRLART
jgi:death-on-curing protein